MTRKARIMRYTVICIAAAQMLAAALMLIMIGMYLFFSDRFAADFDTNAYWGLVSSAVTAALSTVLVILRKLGHI